MSPARHYDSDQKSLRILIWKDMPSNTSSYPFMEALMQKDSDSKRFSDLMYRLSLHFPDYGVGAARNFDYFVESYFSALSDYEIADIAKAAGLYINRGRSFPHVADLIDIIYEVNPPQAVAEASLDRDTRGSLRG
jgi:hypothetical protein